MLWALAHRPRDTYEMTEVEIEAPDSQAAIDACRAQMPEGDLVLFVRKIEPLD